MTSFLLHKATDEVKIVKTCTFEKVRDQLEQAVGGLQSAGVWSNNFNQQPISFGM